jgi:general secretion pathway protein E/type IV pilus assembly protein PilB
MVNDGLIPAEALSRVRQAQAEGASLVHAATTAGNVPEADVLRHLASRFSVAYVDLETIRPDEKLLAAFPAKLLIKHNLLPLREEDGAVLIAASELFNPAGLDELRLATGRELRVALAPSEEIARCARRYLGVGADTVQSLVSDGKTIISVTDEADGAVDLADGAEDASIIRFVNQVLSEAIGIRATDVHFEPFENELRVRYRVDGVLQEARIPPEVRRFRPAIVSRLKILSRLDIAEKRLPQDGRIKLSVAGRAVDVRVSVIPMLHGEAVVLRLLDRGTALLGLEGLGMSARDSQAISRVCELPHGIILVTGPTGSGKTTTLYAALSRINDVSRKIITIEDPIEYHLRGVNQIQIATKAGLTFARGLRSILRHDPDVILIGEIRDRETAEIAVQASLTGHLVFSTLHTNDAAGAVTRLVDMGIEPYLVASSLEAVLAQRLVRMICSVCKNAEPVGELGPVIEEFGEDIPRELFRGTGCRECLGTGYRGRSGVFELMAVNDAVRALILEHASAGEIRKQAVADGMLSLRQDGWRHLRAGRTTVDEVLRVTKDERSNGSIPPAREGAKA